MARRAAEVFHAAQPQLVILDVEVPFGNAFAVLAACCDIHFETTFVTAFSENSLSALNQRAAYYLLRPISFEELITPQCKEVSLKWSGGI